MSHTVTFPAAVIRVTTLEIQSNDFGHSSQLALQAGSLHLHVIISHEPHSNNGIHLNMTSMSAPKGLKKRRLLQRLQTAKDSMPSLSHGKCCKLCACFRRLWHAYICPSCIATVALQHRSSDNRCPRIYAIYFCSSKAEEHEWLSGLSECRMLVGRIYIHTSLSPSGLALQ